MKKSSIPFFKDKRDLFKFLVDNKEMLIAEKKFEMKRGDGIVFNQTLYDDKGQAVKANKPFDSTKVGAFKTKLAINTTNLMDSHDDVHLKGLWKKSLTESRSIKHLQEHAMKFDHIISDGPDLKVYVETVSWLSLGYNFPGMTEVLTFESTIKRARNAYMFDQYSQGYVDNHSVGMQYVTIILCVNDDSEYYGAEYEAWQKYIGEVVNKSVAEEKGYFWAIKEAKVIEGSAVPLGSNYATPTIDNNMKTEPGDHSEDQPQKSTGEVFKYLIDRL